MKDRVGLGKRLRATREYLELTQDLVAYHLGVSRPAISLIEAGKRGLSSEELQKLAKIYGRSVAYYLEDDVTPQVPADLHAAMIDLSEADRLALIEFANFLTWRQKGEKTQGSR